MLTKHAFSLFLVLTSVKSSLCQTTQLELVQVLFRHGDRVTHQTEVYKTDPYDAYFKSVGYGQLTAIGMNREYRIGLLLRSRYDDFLGEAKFNDFYARSTDHERTKMSLQLVLAGVNPPNSQSRWSWGLNWTPVPLNYVDRKVDFLEAKSCPRFVEQFEEAQEIPKYQKKMKKYKEFSEYVKNATKIKSDRLFAAGVIFYNLHCLVQMNLPLPSWCSWDCYQKLYEISALYKDAQSETEDMKRIVVGPFIEDMLKNINNQDKEVSKVKMHLYSAHDTNIAAFLRAHNITNVPKIPDFGSALMIEKRRGYDGKVYLRLLLWTGVSERLLLLKLPNCDIDCPIEKYKSIIEPLLPNDETRSCYSADNYCNEMNYRTIRPTLSEQYLMAGNDFVSFKYPKAYFGPD